MTAPLSPLATPNAVTPLSGFIDSVHDMQKRPWHLIAVKDNVRQWYNKTEARVYRWLQPETAYHTMNYLRVLALLPVTLALPPIFRISATGIAAIPVWINAPNVVDKAPWSIKLVNSIALTFLFTAMASAAHGGFTLDTLGNITTSFALSCGSLLTASYLEQIRQEQQRSKQGSVIS